MSLGKLDNLDMKGADIVSATALLVNVAGDFHDVTGTVTITSLEAVSVGATRVLQFDAACILTHHATDLILPGGANITTAAGDIAVFREYAAGDWCCITYQRAADAPGAGGGVILQVLQAAKTDTATIASSTFTDITGLSQAITPASTDNKILILVETNFVSNDPFFRILRDSTAIGVGATAGSRPPASFAKQVLGASMVFLDSPATVSAVTYKLQWRRRSSGTVYLNRTVADTDDDDNSRTISTITVMEVKG